MNTLTERVPYLLIVGRVLGCDVMAIINVEIKLLNNIWTLQPGFLQLVSPRADHTADVTRCAMSRSQGLRLANISSHEP